MYASGSPSPAQYEDSSVSLMKSYESLLDTFCIFLVDVDRQESNSRKWEPPIGGGLLQMLLLRLEKVKYTDFFFAKRAFHIQIVSEKAKNGQKTGQKPYKKTCLFHACPKIPEMRDPSKKKFPKRGIPQN